MSVSVKNNNVDFAIKKFKTEIAREGTLSKARERADGYKKPGVRHREEKKINTDETGYINTEELRDVIEQEEAKKEEKKECFFKRLFKKKNKKNHD